MFYFKEQYLLANSKEVFIISVTSHLLNLKMSELIKQYVISNLALNVYYFKLRIIAVAVLPTTKSVKSNLGKPQAYFRRQ